MRRTSICYALLFLLSLLMVRSASAQSDSLLQLARTDTLLDSVRFAHYSSAIWGSLFSNAIKAREISDEQRTFVEEHIPERMGAVLMNSGNIYLISNQLDSAIVTYQASLAITRKQQRLREVSAAINNLGVALLRKSRFREAIDCYMEGLETDQILKDTVSEADSWGNIGNIYFSLGSFDKALEHYFNSSDLYHRVGDIEKEAGLGINIGACYRAQQRFDDAFREYYKSLSVLKGSTDGTAAGMLCTNLGELHLEVGNVDSAEFYFKKALVLREQSADERNVASTLAAYASLLLQRGDSDEALEMAERAYKIATESGQDLVLEDVANILYQIYKERGEMGSALEKMEEYHALRDSSLSADAQIELLARETEFYYEQQALADSITYADQEIIRQAELHAEKQTKWILYIGLFMVLCFGGYIFKLYRGSQRQKKTIEQKNFDLTETYDQLEEKNREILDSINYAKRIQEAILVSDDRWLAALPQSFILYKPKDIVAGDFYWMQQVDAMTMFAAADCTGHGVPGAMVSVVCHNALNRAVREFGLTDLGQVLDKTREIVVSEFEKSNAEVKDGMDIALCCLIPPTTSGNNPQLAYAGANNPLWIVRNGEVLETSANKQPIGQYPLQKPFSTHLLDLEAGDVIYVFTDGYVDQFGGEKNKKLKKGPFKKLLLSMQDLPMDAQKVALDEAFDRWKGDYEQVDDVCVLGLRV